MSNPFTGLLDDIRVYDTALTVTELNAIYVPEPSAALLIGFGALIACGRRRR